VNERSSNFKAVKKKRRQSDWLANQMDRKVIDRQVIDRQVEDRQTGRNKADKP
jgi:hypothetical protein